MPISDSPMHHQSARVAWVDYARGACILLVVMMHTTLGVGEAMDARGPMHDLVAFAAPFRIPAFFLVAGLFLNRSIEQPWPVYIDRKVIHFAYFYLLWLTISVALKFGAQGPWVMAEQFALALVEPFGTLWFIYLLAIFYVVTKLARRWPVALWIGAALLQTAQIETGWTAMDEFAARLIYFVTGYLMASRAFGLADWARTHRAAAIGGLALWAGMSVLLMAASGISNPARIPILSLALGMAGAGAVIVASALLSHARLLKFIAYCGANSLQIYLAFFIPMAATRTLIARFAPGMDITLATLLVFGVAVAAPLILARLVSNTPLRFLFERPAALKLPARAARQPAE